MFILYVIQTGNLIYIKIPIIHSYALHFIYQPIRILKHNAINIIIDDLT